MRVAMHMGAEYELSVSTVKTRRFGALSFHYNGVRAFFSLVAEGCML